MPPPIPGCRVLQPTDPEYQTYLPVYNLRPAVRPALRFVCSTEEGVAGAIAWLSSSGVPFAVRSGGHSFEGYSSTAAAVVDVRGLATVTYHPTDKTVTVGAGASLGSVYKGLRDRGSNIAFVAGTCPTVGVAGHVLGGGYGFLSRAFGLACDNLVSLRLLDAGANRLEVSGSSNPDLLWACKGGGGGSFGVATEFTFTTHQVGAVHTFRIVWSLPKAKAKRVIKAWQSWAPVTKRSITCLLKVGKTASGAYGLRCIGQTTGSEAELRNELAALISAERPSSGPTIARKSFFDAVDGFSGGWAYISGYQKERSDYVASLSDAGIEILLDRLMAIPAGHVVALFNAYGGAINDVQNAGTAFPHRQGTGFCVHYYSQWNTSKDTRRRLEESRSVFLAMRPHVSGGAYVNYCDSELPAFERAYWAANLQRLKQVKTRYDPGNLFKHGQSVSPA